MPTAFRLYRFLLLLALFATGGCSWIVGNTTGNIANGLSNAILNSDDLYTVERGLPAYILLLDGLLESDPDNIDLLLAAASLNSAYGSAFTDNPEQRKSLAEKSLSYAKSAACRSHRDACELAQSKFSVFESRLQRFNKSDIDFLYTLGASWASWIEANADDWNAIAQIARVEKIMSHVVTLDETHESGSAHIYLGTLATLLPPAMGGKPEIGRGHFERAIELSNGKNLMAKVVYARRYARLLFERDLHDRLLNEVLAANPDTDGLTLINMLARKEAKALLDSADEYF